MRKRKKECNKRERIKINDIKNKINLSIMKEKRAESFASKYDYRRYSSPIFFLLLKRGGEQKINLLLLLLC